ncbi:MAG: hypothetical protein HOE53_04185 [Candidatus Magasanikbacteria bacterium]|nr:hypothetical protein [Candidatus Magasanikbacteria bacterium]
MEEMGTTLGFQEVKDLAVSLDSLEARYRLLDGWENLNADLLNDEERREFLLLTWEAFYEWVESSEVLFVCPSYPWRARGIYLMVLVQLQDGTLRQVDLGNLFGSWGIFSPTQDDSAAALTWMVKQFTEWASRLHEPQYRVGPYQNQLVEGLWQWANDVEDGSESHQLFSRLKILITVWNDPHRYRRELLQPEEGQLIADCFEQWSKFGGERSELEAALAMLLPDLTKVVQSIPASSLAEQLLWLRFFARKDPDNSCQWREAARRNLPALLLAWQSEYPDHSSSEPHPRPRSAQDLEHDAFWEALCDMQIFPHEGVLKKDAVAAEVMAKTARYITNRDVLGHFYALLARLDPQQQDQRLHLQTNVCLLFATALSKREYPRAAVIAAQWQSDFGERFVDFLGDTSFESLPQFMAAAKVMRASNCQSVSIRNR